LSFIHLLLDLEVGLAFALSIIFAAWLIKLNAHIIISFALYPADKSNSSMFIGYFPGVNHDLLSGFKLVRH